MPDEHPKPPPYEQEKEHSDKPKAPPLPDAPDTMPGQHVVAPLSFNELEYDFKRQNRVEDAKAFDEKRDLARGVKLSDAQAIDKDAETRRTDKRLAAKAVELQNEDRKAEKVELAAATVGPTVDKRQPPPLPDAPAKAEQPSRPEAANQAIAPRRDSAPKQDEPSVQGDKNNPSPQNDMSALMKRMDDIYALLEAMPRIISQFGRLS